MAIANETHDTRKNARPSASRSTRERTHAKAATVTTIRTMRQAQTLCGLLRVFSLTLRACVARPRDQTKCYPPSVRALEPDARGPAARARPHIVLTLDESTVA